MRNCRASSLAGERESESSSFRAKNVWCQVLKVVSIWSINCLAYWRVLTRGITAFSEFFCQLASKKRSDLPR